MELEPARLLVVDDNEMNRDMLSRRLKRQGHSVFVAENGRQAVEMIEGNAFDLVLLDVMMPEMNGYQVLAHLKDSKQLRHVPVIMISALTEMESVIRCIEMGAEDYLPKPFDPVLLRARVNASLEKKRLRDKERLYTQRMERELEIGRQIQAGFFPETLPQPAGWEIATAFQAARQVSGDFYDVFALGDDATALVIADVCDKGVGAALFMALFRTLLRAVTDERYSLGNHGSDAGDPPVGHAGRVRNAVALTNNYIAQTHSRANMFATVFFAVLEGGSGNLTYINAGHEAPFLLRAEGGYELLTPSGPAVGMFPGLEFNVCNTSLRPGDRLLAFTDGVTEARNHQGVFYGTERLLALLRSAPPTATSLLAQIQTALVEFTGGADPADDVTMLAVRRLAVAPL